MILLNIATYPVGQAMSLTFLPKLEAVVTPLLPIFLQLVGCWSGGDVASESESGDPGC